MKKITYILTCLVLGAISFSCTDQSTFNNPVTHELERGAFIKFTNGQPSATVSDPQNISFSDEILDANNNTADFTVGLKAIIGGTTYIEGNFFNTTSFPATFSFTSQSIADAIGVDVTTFSFGDSFEFTATATRNDGVVFLGVRPTFDTDNLTVGPGNTEPNLDLIAYKDAMSFGIIVACAAHIAADMPGTWTVVTDTWADYGGGEQVTVEAGPDDNTFQIFNTTNPAPDNAATVIMIVTVDDSGNVTEITSNELYNYGDSGLIDPTDGGGGLVFSCVGVININVLWLTPDATGSYGTYNFVLTKN